MNWIATNNKMQKLLSILDETIRNYLNTAKKESIENLIGLFESIKAPQGQIPMRYNSALIPLETPREYPLPIQINDIVSATDFLINEKISVGAFDSSYFSPGPHLHIPVHIISVGLWYYNYGERTGGDEFEVFGTVTLGDRVELELIVKEFEGQSLEILSEKLVGSSKLVLFDESFNLTYTLSWAIDKRQEMVKRIKDNILKCTKSNIIPVAVFFTRSRDLIRGISLLTGTDLQELPEISDAAFMRLYLREIGSRSPIFAVYSKPTHDAQLDLIGFYIKLDTHNIIRVEIPAVFRDLVDLVHSVIYSQVIIGNGFPMAMQRAHEAAVITRDHRRIIEERIAELLGRPSIEYVLSKKELSKRWPIV